jgi:outer membrane protein assembly factor BamA
MKHGPFPLAALALLACRTALAQTVPPGADAAGACAPPAELQAQGYTIRSIDIVHLPIFDDEPGLPAIYRWADRLHIDTRDSAIQAHLLFREGERVSQQLIDETLRNLRDLRFIREPSVRALDCRDGRVTLEVAAREVWTTNPGLTFRRTGGENSSGAKIEELNVLGFGKQLIFEVTSDPDRKSSSLSWHDPAVLGSRWVNDIEYRDSDDGQGWSLLLERPFYSLDSRWGTGLDLLQDETVEPVYRLGERVAGFSRDAEYADVWFGRSGGLRNGWTRRLIFGLRRDHTGFGLAPDEVPPDVLPQDRRLDYPYLRIEGVQDDFETTRNRDQIARTEDQAFGIRYALELGWSATALDADRNAALLRAYLSRGWRLGRDDAMFADAGLTTRIESGSATDALLSAGMRYYHPTGPHGVFYTGMWATAGSQLDADHELTIGGDTGLRGYPLRYQSGSGTALLTIEQRFYTKYTLWMLLDVGAAVFFDMGRAFGKAPLGPADNLGILKDVGFGLRLGSKRSALGNVLHVDVAFPLDGPASIDRVQFLVQTKRSF